MSAIKVLNMAGAEVGTVELNDSIFGVEPNTAVVHEVVKNVRYGTISTSNADTKAAPFVLQ